MLPFASRAHFLLHQNFRIRIVLRDGSVNEVAKDSRIHVLLHIHDPSRTAQPRRSPGSAGKIVHRSFIKPSLV